MTGWKIVPREPTEAMQREGADYLPVTPGGATNACAEHVYDAMLAAAPAPAEMEIPEEVIMHCRSAYARILSMPPHGPTVKEEDAQRSDAMRAAIRAYLAWLAEKG